MLNVLHVDKQQVLFSHHTSPVTRASKLSPPLSARGCCLPSEHRSALHAQAPLKYVIHQ